MDFANLPGWFPDLQARDQALIERKKDELLSVIPKRVLPQNHGEADLQRWEAGTKAFLAQRAPFSMVRVGDFEIGFLGAMYWPCGNPTQSYDTMLFRAGYCPEAFPLRGKFIEAVRESALVGVWGENLPTIPYMNLPVILALLGIVLPMRSAVEVNLPAYLLTRGTLFSWLAGQRVLLIGNLAPRLELLWKRSAFHDAYAMFGPSQKIKIAGAIPTSSREGGGAWRDFDFVSRCARRLDYDVALLGCGALAKPLVHEIRGQGKTVLDIGFVFDALTWERLDALSMRPVLRDIRWPKEISF